MEAKTAKVMLDSLCTPTQARQKSRGFPEFLFGVTAEVVAVSKYSFTCFTATSRFQSTYSYTEY